MSHDANSTAHVIATQVTLLGSALTWASANTNLLTFVVFAVTGAASIIYGSRNSKANIRRNEINERNITEDIIARLEDSGKSQEFISEVKKAVRKY